jgi:hypothetical protein
VRLLLALLGPPLLFLVLQSVNYALEPWACAKQIVYPLHASAAVALALTLAAAAVAWREWQRGGGALPDDRAETASRHNLIAVMALMLSVFSALAIGALWATQLVVPPCVR